MEGQRRWQTTVCHRTPGRANGVRRAAVGRVQMVGGHGVADVHHHNDGRQSDDGGATPLDAG